MVYWTAYGVSHNHDTALETVQAVFLRAFECWETVCALAPFQQKKWLFKVTRNMGIDRVRKEKREVISFDVPERQDTDILNMPDQAILRTEQSEYIWQRVQALPELYRAPILLHYFAHLSQKEAADVLQIGGGTFRSRLARGKTMLSRALAKKGDAWLEL